MTQAGEELQYQGEKRAAVVSTSTASAAAVATGRRDEEQELYGHLPEGSPTGAARKPRKARGRTPVSPPQQSERNLDAISTSVLKGDETPRVKRPDLTAKYRLSSESAAPAQELLEQAGADERQLATKKADSKLAGQAGVLDV